MSPEVEITVEDLRDLRANKPGLQLLDIREEWERAICALPGSINVAIAELPQRLDRLAADAPVVVICHLGQRSFQVAHWLRQMGFEEAVSVHGGIDAWARRIDPSMPTY